MPPSSLMGLSMDFSLASFTFARFEPLLEIAQCAQAPALILFDPTIVDLMKRHRIEIVQLLAPAPDGRHHVGGFEQDEMFGHRLAGHVEMFAKLAQSLAV